MATNANGGAADDGAMHRRAARAVERLLSQSEFTLPHRPARARDGRSRRQAYVIAQVAIVSTGRGPLDLEPGGRSSAGMRSCGV